MRTTLDINDQLLAHAKALAASQRTSLTRLIEEGLQMRLRAAIRRALVDVAHPLGVGSHGLRHGGGVGQLLGWRAHAQAHATEGREAIDQCF